MKVGKQERACRAVAVSPWGFHHGLMQGYCKEKDCTLGRRARSARSKLGPG